SAFSDIGASLLRRRTITPGLVHRRILTSHAAKGKWVLLAEWPYETYISRGPSTQYMHLYTLVCKETRDESFKNHGAPGHTHSAPALGGTGLGWPRRLDDSAGVCRCDELCLILVVRQDRVKHVRCPGSR